MNYRIEKDSMGEIAVASDKLWGAQTQRSYENFCIGTEKMPMEMIHALAVIKQAAAKANADLGKLSSERAEAIIAASSQVADGQYDDQFPLSVWQTGSGTQTNMNVNEVIAHICEKDSGLSVHPNDHVNMSQSSNDVFPSAMHIAALTAIEEQLFPAMDVLTETFARKAEAFADIAKTGRTHLQDAVPLTLGQEIGAWAAMLEKDRRMIASAADYLRALALGGTAVGTGLNAHPAFGEMAVREISLLLDKPFRKSANAFASLSAKNELAHTHGALRTLAADLYKIANDVRWLACGPRCGIGEIIIPSNEPGSSIMPGKVNPTQSEAMMMVCAQVMGNDTVIGMAASQGNFQLNTMMPLIISDFLQSVRLLSDAMVSFDSHCARGIQPNEVRIAQNLSNSLMLVTALNPHIGYDNAAKIAKHAQQNNITLQEAAADLGLVSPQDFTKFVDPVAMAKGE